MSILKEELEKIPPKWRTRRVVANKSWHSELNLLYPDVKLNLQIDALINGRNPYCVVCNNPVKTLGKKTCSINCRGKGTDQESRIQKQKTTLLIKYGVDNIRNIVGVEEKRKATMIDKYGSLASDLTRQGARERAPELNRLGKLTIKQRYGVDNISQFDDIKQQKRKKTFDKYGVDHVSQIHIPVESLQILQSKQQLTEFLVGKNVLTASELLGVNQTTVYNKIKEHDIQGVVKAGSSSYEVEIFDWISKFNIAVVRGSKSILPDLLQLDFYFPEVNIAIEFNGLAHHSEFLGNYLRKGKTDFKSYHYNKWKLCQQRGIKLISIFEDEWNLRKDVIKKKILKELKLNSVASIGARKLTVNAISNKKTAVEFLDQHHWQGGIKNFQLGYEAYHGDKLVAVMTFSKRRAAAEYELTRYCIGDGNYPGLFAKMLTQFVSDHSPNKIITFSDNRYASGEIYQNNGFTCVSDLREGYFVTNYKHRWHRSNFQKKVIARKFNLDITNKTELQLIREDLKFDRIWDCGKKKWAWAKK